MKVLIQIIFHMCKNTVSDLCPGTIVAVKKYSHGDENLFTENNSQKNSQKNTCITCNFIKNRL